MNATICSKRLAKSGQVRTIGLLARIVANGTCTAMLGIKWQLTNLRTQDHDFI
jgi:hypothetical protein